MPARRANPFGLAAAAALLALGAGGCPKPVEEGADAGGKSAAGLRPEAPTDGLRLSLPPGWTARPEGPEALALGRGGRTLARLEQSAARELPTTEELQSAVAAELGPSGRTLEALPLPEAEGLTDAVAWMGRVVEEEGTGSTGSAVIALCAKRVGEAGVFLLGTLPGATEGDARAAVGICTALRWGAAGR